MVETQLTIEYLGAQGDGAGRGSRGPVYVERAVPGDRVRAHLYKDAQGIARGEIVEILSASPHRQSAPCVNYDRCGGCTLQHLKPEFYRRSKMERVRDAFLKQGLRPRQWLAPVFLGNQTRRRATFSAIKRSGKVTIGYYRRRSDQITDIDSCLVADPRLMQWREKIRPVLPAILGYAPLDISVQLVDDEVDLVLTGEISKKGDALRAVLAPLVEAGIRRISHRLSDDENTHILLSQGPIIAKFGKLKVALPPASFLQPTPEGEKALVSAVMSAVPGDGRYADLFSGCGTFTGPMLAAGSVDSYEALPQAVSALAKAAGRLPLRAFRRDLFHRPLQKAELKRYDAIVFDPPRAGCEDQALALSSGHVPTLVGVSCNPATFARDARILCEGGYRLQSLQLVDQFLWSHHVEMVGVFTKGKGRRHG